MDSNYRPIRPDEEIRWICNTCGKPLYDDKEAITSENKIFCKECYPNAKIKQKQQNQEKYKPIIKARRGPSAGIYIIGGAFIITGMLSAALCVLFLLNMFFDVLPVVIAESILVENWPELQSVLVTFAVSVSGIFFGMQLIFLNSLARKMLLLGSLLEIGYALYVVVVAIFSEDYYFYIPFLGVFLLFYLNIPDVKRKFCAY